MRLSTLVLTTSLIATSLAAPLPRVLDTRDLGSILDGVIGKIIPGATAAGLSGAIKDAIQNPALTGARIEVVKGLKDTGSALQDVSDQAGATNNAQVQPLVDQAQAGVKQASDAVSRIGNAITSGQTPDKNDQKEVAEGIRDAFVAINGMAAAVTTPDQTLSDNISSAVDGVNELKSGGEGVLSAEGLSLDDLGLPADFLDGIDDNSVVAGDDANASDVNAGDDANAAADANADDANTDANADDANADANADDANADADSGDVAADAADEADATSDDVAQDAATDEATGSAGQEDVNAVDSAEQTADVGNANAGVIQGKAKGNNAKNNNN